MQETQETWVRSLGWEDSLEKGMATHSIILAWEDAMDRGARGEGGYSPWGHKRVSYNLATKQQQQKIVTDRGPAGTCTHCTECRMWSFLNTS